MINLSDKITAKTVENILANSSEIEYRYGDANLNTDNTVASELNNLNDKIVQKVNVGDIVGNLSNDWVPGTVEQYIDEKFDEQNAEINRKLSEQQRKLNTLNGDECIPVDVLPASGSVGVVYRVAKDPDDQHYTDYMWDTTLATPEWKVLATYTIEGLDETPTSGSGNLVKSGGVADFVQGIGDGISAADNPIKFIGVFESMPLAVSALDDILLLNGVNAQREYAGVCRFRVNGLTFTANNYIGHYASRKWVQTLHGLIKLNSDNTISQTNAKYSMLMRTSDDGVISDWVDMTENYQKVFKSGEKLLSTSIVSTPSNSGTTELITSKGVYDFRRINDYSLILYQSPILNTSNSTFTLPAGTSIQSRSTATTLGTDVVFTKPAGYGSHYLFYDWSDGSCRYASPLDKNVVIGSTEHLIAFVRWSSGVYEGHFQTYVKDGKDVVLINTANDAPSMMFNPPLDFHNQYLKILDIGNSHSVAALAYIPNIVNAIGENVSGFSIYSAYFPGATFKDWYEIYNGTKVSSDTYDVKRIPIGDIHSEIPTGEGLPVTDTLFNEALNSTKWDVILIHQASQYSTDYDEWGGTGNAGYLKEFIQVLRKTNPQATICFELIHSYRSTYTNNNPEQNSLLRWKHITEATEKLKKNYGIDFVIPYGTAIQNLRATSLNDEYEFTSDGNHVSQGLGLYTCACSYYQALIAPITGVSILGNTWRKTDLDETKPGVLNINDTNALIGQKAAVLAVYNMWDVMNPESYNFPFVSESQGYTRPVRVWNSEETKDFVQGTANDSTAYVYPQYWLGKYSDETSSSGSALSDALSDLTDILTETDNNIQQKYAGTVKLTVRGQNLVCVNHVISWQNRQWLQVLQGPISLDATTGQPILLYGTLNYGILFRTADNGTVGEWKDYVGDFVSIKQQSLTSGQKTQARTNIGAISGVQVQSMILQVLNIIPYRVVIADGIMPPKAVGTFASNKKSYSNDYVSLSLSGGTYYNIDQATVYGSNLVISVIASPSGSGSISDDISIKAGQGWVIKRILANAKAYSNTYTFKISLDNDSPTTINATNGGYLSKTYVSGPGEVGVSEAILHVESDYTDNLSNKWLCFNEFVVEVTPPNLNL